MQVICASTSISYPIPSTYHESYIPKCSNFQTSACFHPMGLACDVRLISDDLFGWRSNANTRLTFHPRFPCTSSPSVSPTLGSGLACFPCVRSSSVSLLPPAVQSGNAFLLISGVVVPLVFPRLAPLILQLAPAGCFQPQPLFLCAPCSGPRSLVCSTEYYVWCSAPF